MKKVPRKNCAFTFPAKKAAVLAVSLLFARAAFADQPDQFIEIGMSTVLSGPAKVLGENMLLGVQLAMNASNEKGGVNGRKLRLNVLDDGYEPEKTVPNIKRLIEQEHVVAIVGDVGTPTAIAALPMVLDKTVLFFAPVTGAGALRQTPPDRYVINYRASYEEETSSMIDALMQAGIKADEIAFFTQRDGYGDAGFTGAIHALKRHGSSDASKVTHVRYERNTLNVENAVADILLRAVTPRAIIMVGAYAPCAKFIKLIGDSGIHPLFLNVSFVGSEPLAKELSKSGDNVIVTQVVPPYENASEPIVKEFLSELHVQHPDTEPSFGALEGYISTRILLLGLDKVTAAPTSETIVDALESLNSFSIGLSSDLQLSSESHQASHRVWPTILRGGKFLPFEWENLKALQQSRT